MEVSSGACLKRPRDKNGSFPPRSVVARTCSNELADRNSLDVILGLRVARRSDNSDTIPRQLVVDTDADELPVNGASSEQHTGTAQCSLSVPSTQGNSGNASWAEITVEPMTTKPSTNVTARTMNATRLDHLSILELQHELIHLDAVEQELLRDLRSARREYDARVATLTSTGSSYDQPAAAATSTAAAAAASATLPIATTQRLLQLNPLLHQLSAVAAPTLGPTATSQKPCTQHHTQQRLAVAAAEALYFPRSACAGAGLMPPPPPRPPSGVLQQLLPPQHQQQQEQQQAEGILRDRARLPGRSAPPCTASWAPASRVGVKAGKGVKAR